MVYCDLRDERKMTDEELRSSSSRYFIKNEYGTFALANPIPTTQETNKAIIELMDKWAEEDSSLPPFHEIGNISLKGEIILLSPEDFLNVNSNSG